MESDGVKLQFLRQHLERGVRRVFEAQRTIANARIYSVPPEWNRSRSKKLLEALSAPRFSIIENGDGITTDSNIPLYLRFLDMKRYGNLQIYNRQVWGIMFGDTLLDIKAGYRDWVREHLTEMLCEAAINPRESKKGSKGLALKRGFHI